MWKKKNKTSRALMTSLARFCRGKQCATRVKYMRKLMKKEAVAKYGITPVDTKWVEHRQSVRGEANANQITNCCERIQEWRSTRLVCRDFSIGSVESNNVDRNEQ